MRPGLAGWLLLQILRPVPRAEIPQQDDAPSQEFDIVVAAFTKAMISSCGDLGLSLTICSNCSNDGRRVFEVDPAEIVILDIDRIDAGLISTPIDLNSGARSSLLNSGERLGKQQKAIMSGFEFGSESLRHRRFGNASDGRHGSRRHRAGEHGAARKFAVLFRGLPRLVDRC